MSRRAHPEARCPKCHMQRLVCICALLPTLVTRTRLVLVLHRDEERKPTNTGQLAALCLPNSSVVVVGDLARPLPVPLIRDDEEPLLLFPDPSARPLSSFVGGARKVALVVPDGNWRQAGKARARVPGLFEMARVALPEGPPTRYRLRMEQKSGGLATLEAIARAFAVLEGAHVAEALLDIFQVMVERTLWTRGALHEDDVRGGIPRGPVRDTPGWSVKPRANPASLAAAAAAPVADDG